MSERAKSGAGAGAEAAIRYLASRRPRAASAVEALAARRGLELSSAPGGAAESMGRIAEFCLRGKMIRGCLVFLGAEAAGGAALDPGIAGAAAAMELFQAGLLAHDDIMDRDETRRGAPTLHARYAAEAAALERGTGAARGPAESLHLGEALATCLGDLCYFEAFAELARALAGRARAGEIQALCAASLSEVAVAQMADVRWGSGEAEVSEEEILAMYRCKTARYSFSLPLAVGALCAGSGELAGRLSSLGEALGILFQVRDDELGLFGDEAATGKGLGGDLREGKKTLFRSRLLGAAPKEELPRLAALFGGGAEATRGDLDYIRRLSEELGVARSIREMRAAAEEEARAIVGALPGLGPETEEALLGLVEHVSSRDK
jgi:geranylgeranyl diphosphate synthase, type I